VLVIPAGTRAAMLATGSAQIVARVSWLQEHVCTPYPAHLIAPGRLIGMIECADGRPCVELWSAPDYAIDSDWRAV
jgi:hypothetical protein